MQSNVPTPSSILTFSGRWLDVLAPRAEAIDPFDIAHALALQCRFNGMCRAFYSVAEHSVRVADRLRAAGEDVETVRWGLLHDASEAYVGDLPRPLKRQLPGFMAIEQRVQDIIARRFGVSDAMPAAVHRADRELLVLEARALMPRSDEWTHAAVDGAFELPTLSPDEAERAFRTRLRELDLV